MPAALRHRAGVWSVVIAVTALAFTFAVPQLPQLLPQERPVEAGEVFPVSIGTVEGPAGWTLDIRAAATGNPVFTQESLTVVVFDGIWFGSSANLVDNLATTLRSRGAEVEVPQVADDATGASREQYVFDYHQGDNVGHMVVVREDITVMVLRATGNAQDIADAQETIQQMADSLYTGVFTETAPPTDPGVRQVIDDAWLQGAVSATRARRSAR
jgi:hypothetical protein